MAVHKGKIIRTVPVGGGVRRPQFAKSLAPVQGTYFDLLAPRDSRRTIMVQAASSVRVENLRGFECDQQSIVLNQLNQVVDTWSAIAQAFQQTATAAVRVTHSRQHSLDAAIRVSGSRGVTADSTQHLQHSIDRTAEAGLTIFNVIINEQHEIQSHEVAS